MIIVGLTGSIGMGKSTAGRFLRRQGIPVHEADRAVHRLLAPGGAGVAPVARAFPGVDDGSGGVDRRLLGQAVFGRPDRLAVLESLLHPLVRRSEQRFLRRWRRNGCRLAVLDIPLLFETGGQNRVDLVMVVTAPFFIQRARVLARPGMTEQRFAQILERQMPDREKRRRADIIIHSGAGRRFVWCQLRRAVRRLLGHRGKG